MLSEWSCRKPGRTGWAVDASNAAYLREQGDSDALWVSVPPVCGPDGDRMIQEGAWLYNYGIEGVSYEISEGKPVIKPELLEHSFDDYRVVGCKNVNL